MHFGRLFLAAVQIMPPTGASGLNPGASGVKCLSDAFINFYLEKSNAGIDGYSRWVLAHVGTTERFSWSLATLMHRFPDTDAFGQKNQEAKLNYLVQSKVASTELAKNFVRLPL